ncbi:MAG TPA: HAD family phosphatase [Bryobacteraceae bacterium]|jgi:putative hydrolase of the HAD superfamily
MAPANSYDGYIFDYGGVLAHHQTSADQARLAKLAGIPQEPFSDLYWSTRLDYDKGVVTGIEYWANIGHGGNQSLAPGTIDHLIELDNESWMHFDESMWNWIAQLRDTGKRLAVLSNMPRDLGETLKSRTDRFNPFDHITLSYEVHSVKPEPAIYQHCLAGLGTAPERTLFLDDRIANIEGAKLLGVQGIEFLNRDDILLAMRT